MLDTIFRSESGILGLVLRLTLAFVIFPHGAQKVLGWFGGYGFRGTLDYFGSLGIPAPLGVVAILIEFVGPVLLVLGLFGRPVALAIGSVMFVAAWMVHSPNGFFMNWSGSQPGEGFQFHILAMALAFAIVWGGSGAWSLDRRIARGGEASTGDAALAVPATWQDAH